MSKNNNLQALINEFRSKLPGRLAQLIYTYQRLKPNSWQPDIAQNLHRELHNLTGTAGTFSMTTVSAATQKIEAKLKYIIDQGTPPDTSEWTLIGNELTHLAELIKYPLPETDLSPTDTTTAVILNQQPIVYIVHDEQECIEYLTSTLCEQGFKICTFGKIDSFLTALHYEATPDAIVLDVDSPEEIDVSVKVLQRIKADLLNCPPIVILSMLDDTDARLKAYHAGAGKYMIKPVDPSALLDVLNGLMGRAPRDPYRVLIVDDEPLDLLAHSIILEDAGISVKTLANPRQTFKILNTYRPDVLVLDVHMPDIPGPVLAAMVRESFDYSNLSILFLSSEKDINQQLKAIDLGGDDFLLKPIVPEHFISAIIARAKRARKNTSLLNRLHKTIYEREREHLALDYHAIVSIADASGNIINVNNKFCEISGYSQDELIGQNHRIIKSGVHPKNFYEELWTTISTGHVWQGEICNRRKDGTLYWVFSTITPFLNDDNQPYQYISIRTDISSIKNKEILDSERSAMMKVVTEIASSLLAADSGMLDNVIEANLRMIGEHLKVDRAYLFLLDENKIKMSNSHEWCAPNAATQKDELQDIPLSSMPWWWEQISKKQQILITDVDEMPMDAHEEQAMFKALGIHALCAFPIRKGNEILGFLGFDQIEFPRSWKQPIPEVLNLVANFFASSIMRNKSDLLAKDAKERLRLGQIFANIGTWEWNSNNNNLYWTERIAPLFGYKDGNLETSYDNFLNAVHPDDREAVIEAVNNTLEHNIPYDIEHRVVWPDGTVRWLQERGAVLRDDQGTPISMLGVVQDIHERKLNESTLQIFKHVVNSAVDGVIVINSEGAIQLANPAASMIFGYDPKDMIGNNVSILMPDPIRTEHDKYIQRYMSTNEPKIINRQTELIAKRSNGSEFPIEISISEINLTHERHFVGLMRDITERKISEQELIQAREEAESANQAKSDFLSNMSHELRTPMNAILGFSQLVESDEALSEENKDSVREIIKAGDHLLTLINEILDLAKVESGELSLSMEQVNLRSVVDECITLAGPLAKTKSIEVVSDVANDIALIADRTRLKQALLNLITNAIKYNREKGSVKINTSPISENRILLLVKDTGIGIPEGKISELFQPFNRLNAHETEIEGTGIGLVITKRIVELMGGTIGVQSELGVGSKFWLELSLDRNKPTETFLDEMNHNTLQKSNKNKLHIKSVVYIEDNPANIKLVTQIFQSAEHINLLTAHSSKMGIELAMEKNPDLILLDINMPEMDGYQVLKVIKSDDRLKHTPVIAISANAMDRDIERGMKAGFSDYITKPINIHQLVFKVSSHLDCGPI